MLRRSPRAYGASFVSYREQAHPHKVAAWRKTCGSELARDGAIPVTVAVTVEPCQSVTIRECLRVSFMVMYTSSDTAMQAVTYQ